MTYIIKTFFILSLLAFSSTSLFSNENDVINITKNTKNINLYNHIEILEDKQSTLTIDEVSKKSFTQNFQPTSLVGNAFGFTTSSFWVRFTTKTAPDLDDILYLKLDFPQLDYVTLYTPNIDGTYTKKISGELNPAELKDTVYRKFLFRLPTSTQEEQTFYLHVRSTGSVQIPLNILTSSNLIEDIDIHNFVLGGYYGNMLLLMLATFIAFLKIRDYIFLAYGVYILSYFLFQLSMNGFLTQFILMLDIGYSNNVSAFVLGFVIISAVWFSGNFLQLSHGTYPKLKALFMSLIALATVGTFLAFFVNFTLGLKISTVAGVSLPPILLFTALYILYSGYKPAKFFLAAWGVFLFGIFSSGLLFLGYVPYNFLTAYSMQIGSTLELILLSYALIDRLNRLIDEKESATKDAENYLTQINEGLETLVQKRTKELQEKNLILNDMVNKDSMTDLLNHRASLEELDSMLQTASRYKYALCVVMMDIDHFKTINDTYGHQAGDIVIVAIADIIKRNIRQSDIAGRYGGEEFILILHDANLEAAMELSQRIRVEIESLKILEVNNSKVTMSFGVSQYTDKKSLQVLVHEADSALYKAKEAGRNRVFSFKEDF